MSDDFAAFLKSSHVSDESIARIRDGKPQDIYEESFYTMSCLLEQATPVEEALLYHMIGHMAACATSFGVFATAGMVYALATEGYLREKADVEGCVNEALQAASPGAEADKAVLNMLANFKGTVQ